MVAAYRQTHNPSWSAWSDGWRPVGAEFTFCIYFMNRVNSHNGLGMITTL